MRDGLGFVPLEDLGRQLGTKSQIILRRNHEVRALLHPAALDEEPGTNRSPTFPQTIQGDVSLQAPPNVTSGESGPNDIGEEGRHMIEDAGANGIIMGEGQVGDARPNTRSGDRYLGISPPLEPG